MGKVSVPGSLAVVTGAGSGIGRATAQAFASAGAKVVAVDINETAAKETAVLLGAGHHAYAVDVSDAAAMVELAALIEHEHGVPDIVVNNAGIGMSGRFLDTTQADWDAILGVNLRGVINGCAAFGPAMVARGSGQMVNTSSGLGYIPAADTPAYCTTKAGVLHLSRCLRADWAPHGVGVSAICPGVINTPIASSTRYLGANGAKTKELAQKGFSRSHPPTTVAKAIVSAVRHNRSIVPVGAESWGAWYLVRFLPTGVLDLIGSIVSRSRPVGPVPEPTERRVTGAGVELAVREWGDPTLPSVVLVHGFPDTSAVWIPVAEALVDHGLHAVTYDVRGAGSSGSPGDLAGFALDRLVADLHAVVDAVSPDRPVHLVGHDWGSIQGWEAATADELAGRLASYTSISGPPLDHIGLWMRDRIRRRDIVTLLRQGVRSSYVAAMHTPGVARMAWRFRRVIGRTRGAWSSSLARMDGAHVDDAWPAPTFGTDVARGMGLYRANFRPKLRHPVERHSHVPVQLVIPLQDRFVPGWLFDGIEAVAPDLRRREVQARHWLVRSQPVDVAAWIAAFVEEIEARAATGVGETPQEAAG